MQYENDLFIIWDNICKDAKFSSNLEIIKLLVQELEYVLWYAWIRQE